MDKKTLLSITIITLLTCCTLNPETHKPTEEELYTNPKTIEYNYTVNGTNGSIKFTVYEGLAEYLKKIPRTYYCKPRCPSNSTLQLRYLDNTQQKKELDKLAEKINAAGKTREEKTMIAISLVQKIPYDETAYQQNNSQDRYPYQVLYELKGVCGEKSRLLAYLLRYLGYETALLHYPKEEHAAVGIKCDNKYDHKDTGYCFIETTTPMIPTYDEGYYPSFGKITSIPEIIQLSNGTEYNAEKTHKDAQEWIRLQKTAEKEGGYLEEKDYNTYLKLLTEYGLEVKEKE